MQEDEIDRVFKSQEEEIDSKTVYKGDIKSALEVQDFETLTTFLQLVKELLAEQEQSSDIQEKAFLHNS